MMSKKQHDFHLVAGAMLAALVTFIAFLPARYNDFVDLDDVGYIVNNPHIKSMGLETLIWAFTQVHEANWHPLTMLSLAVDWYFWGESASGFHLTNITIHCLTVLFASFLFSSFLHSASQKGGAGFVQVDERVIAAASIISALFFGLHPLRVESVVWASERKDVLCLLFTVLTIWWYIRYAQQRCVDPSAPLRTFPSYWMVLLMNCLALLSKPTAVTLPLILLIIDWYPLSRLTKMQDLPTLLKEKLALFLLASGAATMTILAQEQAMARAVVVNAPSKVLVACKALLYYLWKMLWPSDLAPFYPHPGNVTAYNLTEYIWCLAGIAAICAASAILLKRRPMLPSLWLCYVITLAPMLGLLQVGGQWIADRYTYLPSVAISLAWGGGWTILAGRLFKHGQRFVAAMVLAVLFVQLSAYTIQTVRYIPIWKNTETLTTREIELFPRQAGAPYYSRAKYRKDAGRCDKALEDIDEALAIALRSGMRHKYSELAIAQADILSCLGRMPEALAAAEWAIDAGVGPFPTAYIEFRDKLKYVVSGNAPFVPPSGTAVWR